MSNIKISEMAGATNLNDGDLLTIVQSGVNKKITKETVVKSFSDKLVTVGVTAPQNGERVWFKKSRNLFDKNNANILNNCVTGSAPALETADGCKTLYISCESSTTYTVSKIASTRFIVVTTDTLPAVGVPTSVRNIDLTGTHITITTGASAKYICVFYYYSGTDTLTEQQILDTIQIEEGSTATPYENYAKPSIYVDGELWFTKS